MIRGCFVLALCFAGRAFALVGGPVWVADARPGETFALVAGSAAAPLVVSSEDWPGVLRAARDVQADIERVAGVRPILETSAPAVPLVVLAGTIGRSPLIDGLIGSGKLDVAEVRGRWEAFVVATVPQPLPGIGQALVIAGSDKRGTIYGLYELSRQIGVSPWYWWADVPVPRREEIHLQVGRHVDPGPAVKYRGIFLNDEAPALTGWAHEKFGGFNHRFYEKVFELLLRLRGNYLWPAMWLPRAFNDDDPENPRLADEYGIVMGTTHHEPMMRAHAEWGRHGRGPWNYATNDAVLRDFWRGGLERVKDYEGIVSLGMRGDGDEAMSEETNVALLERIVADQRRIVTEVTGRPVAETPQLWALYKEVQGYYERGMRVPDDVTLLWCDDNWGNLRRLPTAAERGRPGGAGVYYHFDYVGGPRNYKWTNVTPLAKIWEQMHLAWRYGADRIWIVNVGDLKPMEVPIEFFLTYAWEPALWTYERLPEYLRAWAARDFGPGHAAEIGALVEGYAKLNRRRTPELLAPDTYSLVHYREAERVLAEWDDLVARAEAVRAALPAAHQDAYFQLVLYPVTAGATVRRLHVAAGRNRLYTLQGRAAANAEADRVHTLAAEDDALSAAYHGLGGGRWNHLMSEKKFGYTTWQTPATEALPALSRVRPNRGADPALAIEGSELAWPVWGAPAPVLPPIDDVRRNTRWLEVFNRGDTAFGFTTSASHPWLRVSPESGSVEAVARLEVGAAWDEVPAEATDATVTLRTSTGASFTVNVPVRRLQERLPPDFAGFVEVDGHVSIEAPHFSRSIPAPDASWHVLPGHGRTVGGVTVFPVTAPDRTEGKPSPGIEYDIWLESAGEIDVELHCAPSLDFQPGEGLRVSVAFDDEAPHTVRLGTWDTLQTWEKAVADSVRRVHSRHVVTEPGRHVLKLGMVTPGVVIQKIVLAPVRPAGGSREGVRPSYLGPPESPRAGPRPSSNDDLH